MMNKYVTSLELSKQLHEAGVVAETECYWLIDSPDPSTGKERSRVEYFGSEKPKNEDWHNIIPAFMTDELLEILPSNIHLNRNENKRSKSADYRLIIKKSDKYFLVSYNDIVEDIFAISICDDKSLPNAIAKLALELKEQDLL